MLGFSCGTILENYFSALFPERIGRIILDGNDNATDYTNESVGGFQHPCDFLNNAIYHRVSFATQSMPILLSISSSLAASRSAKRSALLSYHHISLLQTLAPVLGLTLRTWKKIL